MSAPRTAPAVDRDLIDGCEALFVDGLEEMLLRHPGRPSELASAPMFTRDGISSVTMATLGRDGEWRGTDRKSVV